MKRTLFLSRIVLFLLVVIISQGCSWIYFREAAKPGSKVLRYSLDAWPYKEYWTGLMFRGEKIGFTYFSISDSRDNEGLFDIESHAVMHFHFLLMDKEITLKARDQVNADLTLDNFVYDFDLDGNKTKLTGKVVDNRLEVDIENQGQTTKQEFPLKGSVYPMSAVGMYPVFHGLEIGQKYNYPVYDGETQSLSTVTQEVEAYEESDLFVGQAYKVNTEIHGQKVSTWYGKDGKPLIEMSLGGAFISGLESELAAREYLSQAAFNKKDVLLDFSLIKTDTLISNPSLVTSLEVMLSGLGDKLKAPNNNRQKCTLEGQELHCYIKTQWEVIADNRAYENDPKIAKYLKPSYQVPSNNEKIQKTARTITALADTPMEQIRLLIKWLNNNIQKKPVDVFTALDVLSRKEAECQGHAYLFTAFARAVGIATRVVNGVVYSEELQGFLYHTWVESFVEGRWISVDPTIGQSPTDATHIKLVEGERILDLAPLVDLIGKIQIRVLNVN